MKTIFYALSLVVILAGAYFSYTVKSKMEAEIALYDSTYATNEQVTAETRSTEKTLGETKESLSKARDKEAELIAKKDVEEGDKRTYSAAIQGYNTAIAGADAELAEVEELIKRIEDLVGGVGIQIGDIPDELEKLKNERLDLQKALEKLTGTEDKLTREVASNRAEIDNLSGRLGDIRLKIDRGAQVGTVTAVDPVWGFVIVNQGAANSNVTEETSLLVSRNGQYLGRLNVSSLEPNQSICDMDTDSFRIGVRVQPGDSVIIANPGLN